ncbi:hypothetical protein FXO38_10553 [Capsicum annuum]|nr:hypothetical protein FXO38_10553 [Capsicum annuum]
MAKFTSQEVEALQKGGNQRAREIYLKCWDPQSQWLPNNSNVDKVRDFIKTVYVDKRYAVAESSDRLPRDAQVQLRRDPVQQVEIVGVPEEYFVGHAFHMYYLTSPDGTQLFTNIAETCGWHRLGDLNLDEELSDRNCAAREVPGNSIMFGAYEALKQYFAGGMDTSSAVVQWTRLREGPSQLLDLDY